MRQRIALPSADSFARMLTQGYMLVMLGLFPLFTGLDGYVLLQDKKFLFFAIITGCWLFLLLLCLLLGARGKVEQQGLCLALFMLCAAAACAMSPAGLRSSLDSANHNGLITYALYTLIVLGISAFGKPGPENIWVFAGAYFLSCVITLLQLLGFNALRLYPGAMNYYSPYVVEMGRFLGPMGNVDIMSAYHCLGIPLLLGYMFTARVRVRFWLLPIAAMGIVCVLWANVASGILALLCTALFVVPRCISARGLLRQRTARCLAAALALAALAAVYFIPVQSGTLHELHCILHGELAGEFGSGRIEIWRDSLRVAAEHPFVGTGPDRLLEYSSVEFRRYSDVLGETLVTRVDDAHNVYLQLFLNFGALGFVPAAAFMVLCLRRIFCGSQGNPVRSAVGTAVLCYMIQGFFNISCCVIAPLACVAAGLLFSENIE